MTPELVACFLVFFWTTSELDLCDCGGGCGYPSGEEAATSRSRGLAFDADAFTDGFPFSA